MEGSLPKPPRPWRVVAHEITHEMNPKKVTQLSEELHRALAQLGAGCVSNEQAQEIKKSG